MKNKIKFSLFATLLLSSLIISNKSNVVNASSISSKDLEIIEDLFDEKHLQEYGYLEHFLANYELNSELNLMYGNGLASDMYYPTYTSSRVQVEDILHDTLFDNYFDLDYSFKGNLDLNIQEFNYERMLFPEGNFYVNDKFYEYDKNYQYSYEPVPIESGITCTGTTNQDGEQVGIYEKIGFSSVGGVSLIGSDIYLNTYFDEILSQQNNLDIAFKIDSYNYSLKDMFTYFNVLSRSIDEIDGYGLKIPIISVDGTDYVYVVLTGGEPMFATMNSNFKISSSGDVLYLTIPYKKHIEKVRISLPYFTGGFHDDYCEVIDTDLYGCTQYLQSTPEQIYQFFTSFEPYWFNNENELTASKLVHYYPIKIDKISHKNNYVSISYFANKYYSTNKFEVQEIWLKSDHLNNGKVKDYSLSYYDLDNYNHVIIDNKYPYISVDFEFDSVLLKPLETCFVLIDELFYTYWINNSVAIEDYYPESDSFEFKSNKTSIRVYLKSEIKTKFYSIYNPTPQENFVHFNFYDNDSFIDEITGIDQIIFAVEYGDKKPFEYIIKNGNYSIKGINYEWHKTIDFGSFCKFNSACNNSPSDDEYGLYKDTFYVNSDENLFDSTSGFKKFINKSKGYDFTYKHITENLFGIGYKKHKVNQILYGYCNFFVNENTYIKGGTGTSALHKEFDENGNLIGIFDKNGYLREDYIVNENGVMVNKETGETFVDDKLVTIYKDKLYVGDIPDEVTNPTIIDTLKSLLNGELGELSRILSILLIIILIVLCVYAFIAIRNSFFPITNKVKRSIRNNRRKRNRR